MPYKSAAYEYFLLTKSYRYAPSPPTMTEFHPKLHWVFPLPSSVPPLLGRGRNSVTQKKQRD